MSKFNVGDRVRYKEYQGTRHEFWGAEGTIVRVSSHYEIVIDALGVYSTPFGEYYLELIDDIDFDVDIS